MEFDLYGVHTEASVWDVKKAVAQVLHENPGPDFFGYGGLPEQPRKLNFKVELGKGPGGVRNNGRGVLTVPSKKVGKLLSDWTRSPGNAIVVLGRRMRLAHTSRVPRPDHKMMLEQGPYVDPDTEEYQQQKFDALHRSLLVDEIQFGILRPPRGPKRGPRTFAIEFSEKYEQRRAQLTIEWKYKQIRLDLGDGMTEAVGHRIAIPFTSIAKIELGWDSGRPFVCFELFIPPMFEEYDLNRQLRDDWNDMEKYRRRVPALNERHASIAPYAHHLRILLYRSNEDPVDAFIGLCKTADEGGLRIPVHTKLEANANNAYFGEKKLRRVRQWLRGLDWSVAFQVELLLHNGLLHTEELLFELQGSIDNLCRSRGADAGSILRSFAQALRTRPPLETVLNCFNRVEDGAVPLVTNASEGSFSCHHMTVTPTRWILEGPYVVQSNRVIRQYSGFENNFLRVDFRDEDRLQFRWDRDIDGGPCLQTRVGTILKDGFELAGRKFEFLAYSSSALRSHSVWFMTPFEHPDRGDVNAAHIRDALGRFRDTILMRQPSKYAARLAQAFTATDPSVRITKDQREVVDDIGSDPNRLHTDGCGTISPELGDKIWAALCAPYGHRYSSLTSVKPTVYQIRYLGFKGVVSVDEQLKGIKMRLRRSMKKFDTEEPHSAEIEIAEAFDKPRVSYLNRPLIMVLEDRGVTLDAFTDLQEVAVKEARTINDSIERFSGVLVSHNLGTEFRLAQTLRALEKLGFDLQHSNDQEAINNQFIVNLQHFAMNHILRDIKHKSRILIPESWLLVGVADEGPAYEGKPGYENVYSLPEGKIYACVQKPGEEPVWIEGRCILYRSPVVHPGDVLSVFAIGRPPEDRLCLFGHLRNVVVLPSVGERSMASCMGGGDVDGDLFNIVKCPDIHPTKFQNAAAYPPGQLYELDHDSTVDDICDFIVEYIHSDVLGLLSVRHLIIADQSKDGTLDRRCMKLARMCSQAVDYPKNGVPVNIDDLPRYLIPFKPDWQAAEVANPHKTDYYESSRAIGHLYRAIQLQDVPPPSEAAIQPPLSDQISQRLLPLVRRTIEDYRDPDGRSPAVIKLFRQYVDEVQYISMTHTISQKDALREEEVVVGSIMAKCSQTRWRSDRITSMRVHVSELVGIMQRAIMPQRIEDATEEELKRGLTNAWAAWDYSARRKGEFGANSFGLVALGLIFDLLKKLDVELGYEI